MTMTSLSSLEPQFFQRGACVHSYTATHKKKKLDTHAVRAIFHSLKPAQRMTFPPFLDSFMQLETEVLL